MKNRILSILLVFICTAISIIHTSADTEEDFRIDSALDENGLLYVTGFSGSDIPDTVTIPSEINGVKVEGLKNFEILGNGDIKRIPFDLSGIKKLVIEEGAKNISCTFIGSSELEAVVLPESLKNISSDAFREAAKLSDINLENVETVGSFAFYGCSSLKEVRLATATKVGISAFGNIKDLKMYGNRSSAAEEYAKNNRVLYERLPLETPKGTSLTVDGHTYYGFETYAIKLNKLGLMQGVGVEEDGKIDFDIYRTPTRLEAIITVIRLTGAEEKALATEKCHPFTDVPEWADSYVSYAYKNGMANGISETLFDSYSTTLPEMYITYLLRTLGYTDSGENADFKWDDPWALANELYVTERNAYLEIFLRSEMTDMMCNALSIKLKGTDTALYEKLISDGVFTKELYDEVFGNGRIY